MRDIFDLTGRNVLITGGGRGLGKAMAIGLAERGANVAIADIDLELSQQTVAEIQALGVQARAIRADVIQTADATGAVDDVLKAWGSLDVLVNNAGIAIQCAAEDT